MVKKKKRRARIGVRRGTGSNEPGVIVAGRRCGECGLYTSGRQMVYSNCDNDALGWVSCLGGGVVRRDSIGCGKHTANVQTSERIVA